MCKFNNRLFIFAWCCLLGLVCVLAKPVQNSPRTGREDLGLLMALSELINPQDEHYDQRQKGEENYRIKLDGFFIGLPQEDSSTLLLLTDGMIESLDDDDLLAFGKNRPDASSSSTSLNKSTENVTPSGTKPNQYLSSNIEANAQTAPSMLVEIPASKKYLEARHSVDSLSKTKSYISHFLNLLKRVRKH